MNDIPSIQWFPGHMAKTRRLIRDHLKLVDAVIEITDARIPLSSRNPELSALIGEKPCIVLLNKCDMANDQATAMWTAQYKNSAIPALPVDCRTGKGIKNFVPLVYSTLSDLLTRRQQKGMKGRQVRLMIVGIPNVGKSSFINRMAGSSKTKVEDRPGVTKGKQWVSLEKDIELLDMPGILWPKFEDPTVGEKLAFTGAVKDDVLDTEALASRLLFFLGNHYPECLRSRYGISEIERCDGWELLEKVGRKRGMLISGGEIHTERAAIMVLDEFRGGKLGKITLELPDNVTGGKQA